MSSAPLRLFATTARGTEEVLGEELGAIGARELEVRRGGVAFAGDLEAAYRACLWSRVASRVLFPLRRFPCPDEDALYAGVREIAWREHLEPGGTLAVDFTTSGEAPITHTHYGALRTKDAIVDQLREETGTRPSVDTARPDVRVNVHLGAVEAQVAIDLSGEALHRRGYRVIASEAPLKENLAAALLLLTGWPALARAGRPFLDPMCGSGTLAIEAALIAGDIAPGLGRDWFGFLGWRRHDAALWRRLRDEASARAVRDPARLPSISGFDIDERTVRSARENARRAGLAAVVRFERRALADTVPGPMENMTEVSTGPAPPHAGLLLTNPPYGERLGEEEELGGLYATLGDVLRRRFPGWLGCVFTGNPELARRIGLRPARRHVLWNGAIECRLLELPISTAPVAGDEGPAWRRPRPPAPPSPESEAFANRLRKDWKHLQKWARREGVTCFRVYDADLPEYAVAVDWYQGAAHVQEYQAPKTVDPDKAARRLADAVARVAEVLDLPPEEVHLKVRRRHHRGEQYEKLGAGERFRVVDEGGHRFLVNLDDYLDTGLFLDHRSLRALLATLAPDRRFLNLFAYTATATVYAARAGARSTTSVDLSNTYLEWARQNLDLNDVRGPAHRLVRADVLAFLPEEARAGHRYGLIFAAPPTFSASKSMDTTFDVQRDHVLFLRQTAALLEPDGVLLFSPNLRRFRMDTGALVDLEIEDLSRQTLPPDFAGNPRIHSTWRIRRRPG